MKTEILLDKIPGSIEVDEVFKKCDCGNGEKRISFKTYVFQLNISDYRGGRDYIARYTRADDVKVYFRGQNSADVLTRMIDWLEQNNLSVKEIAPPSSL